MERKFYSIIDQLTDLPSNEQRFCLEGVTWQQYDALVALFMDQFPALRMTYLEGVLELISTSPEHERLKTIIGRLIEAFAEEADIDLNGYGSATFRKEAAARGLEPDECYTFGVLDQTPDIAVEIVLTSGGIDKLAVYQGLGVQEVWFLENRSFRIHSLIDQSLGYEELSSCQSLSPNLAEQFCVEAATPTLKGQFLPQ